MTKASITISQRQREMLTQILSFLDAWPLIQQRAQVVLLSAQGLTVKEIADQTAITQATVAIWRREWRKKMTTLQEVEDAQDDTVLILTIINALHRGSTKVKSSKISEEQLVQLIAIFEEDPKDSGYEIESWTMHAVANEGIQRGIVPPTITGNKLASELRKIGFRNETPPP